MIDVLPSPITQCVTLYHFTNTTVYHSLHLLLYYYYHHYEYYHHYYYPILPHKSHYLPHHRDVKRPHCRRPNIKNIVVQFRETTINYAY